MKRIFSLIISCIIVATALCLSSAEEDYEAVPVNVNIAVNGQWVKPERQPLAINGSILAPARSTLANLGITVNWYEDSGKVILKKGNDKASFEIGVRKMIINGIALNIDIPPVLSNGTVMIPLKYAASAFSIPVQWDPATKGVILSGVKPSTMPGTGDKTSDRVYTVVIDAGHGGSETGAVYYGVKEKDLNISIAQTLEKLLKESGVKTYMTRTDDSFVGLYTRSGLANRVNADLLVSIHNNAGYMRTTGTMTLYHPESGHSKGKLTAKRFAQIVQNQLVKDLDTVNHGIISRPELAVLRTSKMPAVIAEIGFMTNKTELGKLKTASYRQKAAESLRNAVLAALKEI